jgi:hypothetical protein
LEVWRFCSYHINGNKFWWHAQHGLEVRKVGGRDKRRAAMLFGGMATLVA